MIELPEHSGATLVLARETRKYRAFEIDYWAKPIPDRRHDWTASHEDGDGAPDGWSASVSAPTLAALLLEIDVWWLERDVCVGCGCCHDANAPDCDGEHNCFADECPCVDKCSHDVFLSQNCRDCGRFVEVES